MSAHYSMRAIAVRTASALLIVAATVRCGSAPTLTAPTPATSTTAANSTLRVDAFSVTEFLQGTSYAYRPRLTLTASAGGKTLTVTGLWFELENGYNSRGSYFRDANLPYRILADTTRQLFDDPSVYLDGEDFRAARVFVYVSYIDDGGRSGEVEAAATVVR